MMEEIESQLDRLERRFCANYRHQMENRRRVNPRHMETKLMMNELKAANEELIKLLESTMRIQSSDCAPQSEAQPIEDSVIQNKVTNSEISSDTTSHVVEDKAISQHEVIVAACDEDIMNDKFIIERSCTDDVCVSLVAQVQFPPLLHKTSLRMLWLNDHDNTEVYSQKREAFPIYTIQDEMNDRTRGMWFVSSNLQIDLLDMEPSSTIKIKDANHIFKPGGMDCLFLHTYLYFGNKIRDESS